MSVRDVDPAGPGLRRRRFGRGFGYIDERGRRIADAAVIDRIKALAIPRRGRTCGSARTCGATSRPADWMRGRRQYRYHDEWRAQQDRDKHDRMLELARALPAAAAPIAPRPHHRRAGPGPRLACAVRLLELGLFRVGGEPYVEENGSYGSATLRKRHVRAVGGELRFDYPGKGNQRRAATIGDAQVADVVRALKRRRGPGTAGLQGRPWALGGRAVVGHQRVHAAALDRVLAKDFRTWTATVLAAVALAAEEDVETERQRRKAVVRVVRRGARARQHTGRGPWLLCRPPGDRALRGRRDRRRRTGRDAGRCRGGRRARQRRRRRRGGRRGGRGRRWGERWTACRAGSCPRSTRRSWTSSRAHLAAGLSAQASLTPVSPPAAPPGGRCRRPPASVTRSHSSSASPAEPSTALRSSARPS